MSKIAWVLLVALLATPLNPLPAPAIAAISVSGSAKTHVEAAARKRKAAKKHARLAPRQAAIANRHRREHKRHFESARDLKPRYRALARGVGYWSGMLRTAAGPVRISVLKIDLRQAEVAPVVARNRGEGFGLERLSSMAARTGAIAGINGSFFSPRNKQPMDLLVVNGRWLSQSGRRPALVLKDDGTASIVAPRQAQDVPLLLHAVGGGPTLLRDGRMSLAWWPRSIGGRAPRTAAGLTWDGKVLLVTIDGRSRHSVGATIPESSRYMAALGAREAMNLDGGGSSTMVVGPKVVNRPSDGFERAVSNGLLIFPRRPVAEVRPSHPSPYSGIHLDRS